MTTQRTRHEPEMNVVISNVLKYGVLASAIFIGLGIAILFLNTPPGFPSTTSQLLAANYGNSRRRPDDDAPTGVATPIRCT